MAMSWSLAARIGPIWASDSGCVMRSCVLAMFDDGRDVVFLEVCQCAALVAEDVHDVSGCYRFVFQAFRVATEHADKAGKVVSLVRGSR